MIVPKNCSRAIRTNGGRAGIFDPQHRAVTIADAFAHAYVNQK